eukprot:762128-Hanusia_phi.AAC.15
MSTPPTDTFRAAAAATSRIAQAVDTHTWMADQFDPTTRGRSACNERPSAMARERRFTPKAVPCQSTTKRRHVYPYLRRCLRGTHVLLCAAPRICWDRQETDFL